jgi:hypothetical protein
MYVYLTGLITRAFGFTSLQCGGEIAKEITIKVRFKNVIDRYGEEQYACC